MPDRYIRPGDVSPEDTRRVLDALNAANTAEELAAAIEIPGVRDVGVRVAQRIVGRRQELGGFTSLQQVAYVEQVGRERFTEIVVCLSRTGEEGETMTEGKDRTIRVPIDASGIEDFDPDMPLKIVAPDYHAQAPYVMESGALLPAVAASIALPALFKPVQHDGRILLDGGLTNPLPFDLIEPTADITIASHVLGGPSGDRGQGSPSSLEAAIASSQIMQDAIVREKLKGHAPDIVLRPNVDRFRVLEFYRIREILRAAAPIKDELKRALDVRINAAARKTL